MAKTATIKATIKVSSPKVTIGEVARSAAVANLVVVAMLAVVSLVPREWDRPGDSRLWVWLMALATMVIWGAASMALLADRVPRMLLDLSSRRPEGKPRLRDEWLDGPYP